MTKGFEQAKLDRYVDQAHDDDVTTGSSEWMRASVLLEHVQARIAHAANQATRLGGETGPAASKAFAKSATAMGDKAGQLREGSEALRAAAAAIVAGRNARDAMGNPGSRPSDPDPLAPGATDKEIAKHSQQQSAVSAWDADQERRERIARKTTADMDTQFRESTAVMKKIHGEPDPVPKPTGPEGPGPTSTPTGPGGETRSPYDNGGRTGTKNNDTGVLTNNNNDDDNGEDETTGSTTDPPTNQQVDYPIADEGDMTAEPTGNSQSSWTGSNTGGAPAPGGLTGGGSGGTTPATSVGAGAGISGAGLLGASAMGGMSGTMGGVRGGLTPVSSSSSGVRPIGSTVRSATTGTLGRGSTPVGSGSGSGSGASGRSGGGRSAGGGRGAAGGRGGSAGATGRGGDRSKGSKKSARDHMDEEWEIDDEDAAPSVLD